MAGHRAIQLHSVSGRSREEWVSCFCGAGRDPQPALAWRRRQALPTSCICVYDFLKENPSQCRSVLAVVVGKCPWTVCVGLSELLGLMIKKRHWETSVLHTTFYPKARGSLRKRGQKSHPEVVGDYKTYCLPVTVRQLPDGYNRMHKTRTGSIHTKGQHGAGGGHKFPPGS